MKVQYGFAHRITHKHNRFTAGDFFLVIDANNNLSGHWFEGFTF